MSIAPSTLKTTLSPRLQAFVAASRQRGAQPPPSDWNRQLSQAYARYAPLPWRECQARALADALASLPVYLFPDEHLVGMVYHLNAESVPSNPRAWGEAGQQRVAAELPESAELVALQLASDGASPGHVTWHWDWVLERGLLGLRDEYRAALAQPCDETAADFYRGVILALEAVLRWNERHVAALEAALAQAPADDQPRLKRLIALCRRVPAYPARSFHEAVQSFYLQHLAVLRENPFGGNGPGRLDYYLWPYLQRDLEAGRCTLEEARELIAELFVRLHERIQDGDGWVEAVVVGGSFPDGRSAVNPLSHILVETILELDQLHPSIYLRMPQDPPDDYVELAARYLLEGHNRAQILNDPAVTRAMRSFGMAAEDAVEYTCGGCMEIVPQGLNSDLLFAGYHNVPKIVELVLTGGECLRTGRRLALVSLPPLESYADFEALYAAFEAELYRELGVLAQRYDLHSQAMAELRPAYLLSSMTLDCLARGRELHDGGARYPDYGAAPLGIPNAGDALYAAKRALFDDRLCSPAELLAALRADFQGYEALRLRLRALPKYGQQHAEADAMANRVLDSVCGAYAAQRTRWGGRLKPVVLTFVWAPVAGEALGATAYGEHAGRPIAQSLSPQSAAMTQGITAAIGSHAGLCLQRVAGGASSMWDLDPTWATPEVAQALLRSFLRLGGHIFQGNTTSVDELLRAREQPELYPNLFVRVGGFSARFVTLGRALQDEVIARYRHAG